MATLYLFADTNLFVQCRPLEQLDWSAFRSFAAVEVIVSRPVQAEIDRQKNKGADRLGKRARAVSSLFRDVILGAATGKVVKDSQPLVTLVVKPELRASRDVADRLDYETRDDQLVGTAYGYQLAHPDAEVRLLTHDTGPMAAARMLGLKVHAIPDDWLLPPEANQAEREVAALRAQVAKLRDAEPNFVIACYDGEQRIDALTCTVVQYSPLGDSEVAELIGHLRSAFPADVDVPPLPAPRLSLRIPGLEHRYVPPTEEELQTYREQTHSAWLQSCATTLRNYHATLKSHEAWPTLKFAVSNDGVRPARDVLVEIAASGAFQVRPPPKKAPEPSSLALPNPPAPPRGQWRYADARFSETAALMLTGLSAFRHPYPQLLGKDQDLPPAVLAGLSTERDPNAFYYQSQRPLRPTAAYKLVCAQWRHGVPPRDFRVQVHLREGQDSVRGAVTFTAHAENLSEAATLRVPVRISVQKISAFERAKAEVARLVSATPWP